MTTKAYPPQTIATPLTIVRRERMLPAPGEILVAQGDRVEPVQLVATARVATGFRIINVARQLKVHPSAVPKYLKVKPGDAVKRNQVLAALRGLGARSCRSPIEGTVTGSGRGMVLVETAPIDVEVLASVRGVVSRVIPEWGVVIRTTGAMIQGFWGNKKENIGILRLLVEERDESLDDKELDPSCRGMVLVGGSHVGKQVLEEAREVQVSGIITGSILPDAVSTAYEMPYPVITTEGIGSVPMCSRIFHLLSTNEGREVTMDAKFRHKWDIIRPEIIVPLPAEPEAAEEFDLPLEIGDLVRVIQTPHLGTVGTVKDTSVWLDTPSGQRLAAVRITPQDSEEDITVAAINLEIMR